MIPTFDYLRTLAEIEEEIVEAILQTLHSGQLILGSQTRQFEQAFAQQVGAEFCIGVTSGTTALHLAMLALDIGPGDEVITTANTCPPTIAAIELTGATPVLVEVYESDLLIDPEAVIRAITPDTRGIVPVHLWGQSVDIEALLAISQDTGIPIIEDCAQGQGTLYRGQHVGTFGRVGCFSFYPTKNLGAYGDAGAIVTNDRELAERITRMRMYGYSCPNYAIEKGMNARIAEIQAAILTVKLAHLDGWLAKRRANAARYQAEIVHPRLRLPHLYPDRVHAYHQFVIRCPDRPALIQHLEQHGIGYGIHYPVPIHQMPAYLHLQTSPLPITEAASGEILSIPVHEALEDAEVSSIIQVLNSLP